MSKQRTINLIPPLISPDHIKEKITCIRAHRERIFQVFTQNFENKWIFHNYGQGGAGWTFLFGCVNESIRQFESRLNNLTLRNKAICVIGAGCYGLLTAVSLAHKGYDVRVVAKNLENISSYKAAGFFFPRPRKSSTPQEIAIFRSMGLESYISYQKIIDQAHPFINIGPKILPAYYGLDIDPGFSPCIADGLINCPEKVTIDFGNNKVYEAMEYKTIFINSNIIMEELQRNIIELGITINKREINSFKEIDEPIIFNCTGLGAKNLAEDKRIVPVQGHLITLKNQPNIEDLQYMINFKVNTVNSKQMAKDELIYYAPKESGILGITFIGGQDSLTANQHEFERLMERGKNYFGV